MEIGLLLLIVGFIVVAYLIFKFIKKVVFAVITVVLLFCIVVGAVVGLVYMDFKHLTGNQSYDVQVVYSLKDDYKFGIEIPVENSTPDMENMKSVSEFNLNSIDVDEISTDDNVFVVVINDETFSKLLVKDEYSLEGVEGFDSSKLEGINLSLSKEEVLAIVNSDDGAKTLVNLLFVKNKIEGPAYDMLAPIVEEEIEKSLSEAGLSLNEALFLFVIYEGAVTQDGVMVLFEDFKNKDVEIYPERLSFKVLRMLPIDTINGFFSDSVEAEK